MFKNIGRFLRSISHKVWNANLFFSNVLIPIGILTIYFISFSRLLPEGVNNAFLSRSWKYLLPIAILLYLAFFTLIISGGVKRPSFITKGERIFAGDVTLLLLPLAPVIQYILNNQDILSPFESLSVFSIFTLFAALLILVIPILFRRVGSTRTLVFLGLAFAFSITNMAALSQQLSWYAVGGIKIQLAIFGGVFLTSWLLFHLNQRMLLYLLVAVYFSTTSVFQLFTRDIESTNTEPNGIENRLVTLIDSKDLAYTPNIYLLVYDAYVANETMLGYGIDNLSQERYLEELGFQLYPQTYSVGAFSISTMSRVLNASVDSYGNLRKGVSGDGVVQNLLKGFGYETYGVFSSDYYFRGITSSYDYAFPGDKSSLPYSSSASALSKAILMGEFRFDVDFDKEPRQHFIEEKINFFSQGSEDPKFIYMHTNLPSHSQNSGACLLNETELYEERLLRANLEMQQDVETIIEIDPAALVIVAGDHGPYLTKNCDDTWDSYDISEISRLDIQDRFGTFLAIKWPSEGFEEYDDIVILQDLFPAIFAYLFQDSRLLDSRIEPTTLEANTISGAAVVNGVIEGGIDSGEPLFTEGNN